MSDYVENIIKRLNVEETENWRDCMCKIPALPVKSDWLIQLLPPFGGAMARMRVGKGKASVSVYADFHDRLGCMGHPYWEIYPYQGDTFRCDIGEADELVAAIEQSLNDQLKDTD